MLGNQSTVGATKARSVTGPDDDGPVPHNGGHDRASLDRGSGWLRLLRRDGDTALIGDDVAVPVDMERSAVFQVRAPDKRVLRTELLGR